MEYDKLLPVYLQIVEIVKFRIIRQEYMPRDMLPSIKDFAKEFDVSYTTFQRVYAELVRQGYITIRRGSGYQVIDEKKKIIKLGETALKERFQKLHMDAKKMGISDIECCQLFDKYLKRDEIEK